jgi:hypothetical protein
MQLISGRWAVATLISVIGASGLATIGPATGEATGVHLIVYAHSHASAVPVPDRVKHLSQQGLFVSHALGFFRTPNITSSKVSAKPGQLVAEPVDGTEALADVSCVSATTCYGVGDVGAAGGVYDGVLVPIVNGVPQTATVVSGTGILNGISCYSASTCEAVGNTCPDVEACQSSGTESSAQGVVVQITNGDPGAAKVVPGTAVLEGLDCDTNGDCESVGSNMWYWVTGVSGVVLSIDNGNPGAVQTITGSVEFYGVSCPQSSASCTAVGVGTADGVDINQGVSSLITDGNPSAAQFANDVFYFDVTCYDSTADCTAVGDDSLAEGVIFSMDDSVADDEMAVANSTFLSGITCPATSLCDVGGTYQNPSTEAYNGVMIQFNPLTFEINGSYLVDGAEGLIGVACPSDSFCIAVGVGDDGDGVMVTLGAASYELGVYTNVKYWDFADYVLLQTPHVFFELINNTASPPTDQILGFVPTKKTSKAVTSRIRDDSGEPWTWRILYPLTAAQFSSALQVVTAEQRVEAGPSPPKDYQFLSTNCVWFAAKVASAAGQVMPDYLYGNIPDPGTLRNSLRASGNGSTLDGGTVSKNS